MDCLSAVSRPLVDIESRSPMTTSGAMPSDIALSKPESTARTSSNSEGNLSLVYQDRVLH